MTAQIHEEIVYEGRHLSLACTPELPEHPRIVMVSPEDQRYAMNTTECWRNYVGEWQVTNGRLYLTGISGIYRLEGDEPLFAEWYTGTLRIPTGPQIEYVHGGFGSTYATEMYVDVKSGVVSDAREEHYELKTILAAREAAQRAAEELRWEENRERVWKPVTATSATQQTDWTTVLHALDAKYNSYWFGRTLPRKFTQLMRFGVPDDVIGEVKRFGVVRRSHSRGMTRGVEAMYPTVHSSREMWGYLENKVIVSAFLGALEPWAAATDVSTPFLRALRELLPLHRHGMYFNLFSDITDYIGTPPWTDDDRLREQAAAQIATRLRALAKLSGVRINDYVWNSGGSLARREEHTLGIWNEDTFQSPTNRIISDAELVEYPIRRATSALDAKLW